MSNQSTNKNPSVSLRLTRAIRYSSFLASNSPQDFQSLIALCTFADKEGKLKVSSKTLAFVLNLSEKQAAMRLKRICEKTWQGQPLVIKEESKARFTSNKYRLMLPKGLMLIKETNFPDSDFRWKDRCMEAERKKGSPLPEAEVSYNSVVVNNKNTTTDRQKLLELLKAKGITENTAKELVEKYPKERIIAQVKMLPYRKAQNPAGMLIKSIKENWDAPLAYLSACGPVCVQRTGRHAQASKKFNEFSAQRAKQKAEDERRAKEEKRRLARIQKIREFKERMSKKELKSLRHRAIRNVKRIGRHIWKYKMPPNILIQAEMNKIIGMEYLKET